MIAVSLATSMYPALTANSKEVGMGQINTQNTVRYFSQNGGGFNLAVQICDELAVNGYETGFCRAMMN
ncbi:hypothetical protein FACS1894172_11820 [Spirochaetia bacterium]|nr:hypothetical protein FACS1894172_11820 [Spirochaetia bacterium]